MQRSSTGSRGLLLAGGMLAAVAGASCSQQGATAPGERPDWHQMSFGQKKEHMKQVVVPTMKPIFQGIDAQEFAEFGCETCHGKSARSGRYDMPAADLPPLSADLSEEKANHPQITKAMMEQVVPEMAKTIDERPYDPKSGQGFGCFDCHTKK